MVATAQAQPEVKRVAPVVLGRKDYISVLLRLIGMDLYKVRRRLLSKGLMISGTLVVAGVFFLVGLAGWYTANRPLNSFNPPVCSVRPTDGCVPSPIVTTDQQQAYKNLQLKRYAADLEMPGVWDLEGTLVISVLAVLAIILSGSLVGGEYSLGTVRLMFSRGPTRLQFLIAKMLVIAICIVPAMLLLFLVGTLVGAVMAPVTGIAANFSFWTAAWFGNFVLYLLLGMAYWFVYSMMALFFGTLGRSTVAGIVGPLVWLSIEPILSLLITRLVGNATGGLADFINALPNYFLGNNISSLIQNQQHVLFNSNAGSQDNGHALLVIGVYLVVFLGVSFWLTKKRDITH